MKLHLKSFISGVIVASLCVTSVSAFAVIKSVEFNTNRVVFDGREISMVGSPMISLVKQGQTDISNYMPLRAVLEDMGYDVTWDGTTKTVYINTKFMTQKAPSIDKQLVGYWTYSDGGTTVKYHFGEDGHFDMVTEIEGSDPDVFSGTYTVDGSVVTLDYNEENDEAGSFTIEMGADGKSFIASILGESMTFASENGDTSWAE